EAPWSTSGQFQYGTPQGGPRDPVGSFDADGIVLGTVLDGDGLYSPMTSSFVGSPVVSTQGYTNVRLQYQRWLSVEDGFFDQAWISADDTTVWSNYASESEEIATFHHTDREWRFHDVDLSTQAADGSVMLAFQISSDGGLQLGGWNIDQLCVVAFDPAAST